MALNFVDLNQDYVLLYQSIQEISDNDFKMRLYADLRRNIEFDNVYKYFTNLRGRKRNLKNFLSSRFGVLSYIDNVNNYFVTFTINDYHFDCLNYETLVKYVQRALKCVSLCYVFNSDFGGETMRLHFHALVASTYNNTDFYNKLKNNYKCGFINVKKVTNDSDIVSSYVTKLYNHMYKVDDNKIYYSRR